MNRILSFLLGPKIFFSKKLTRKNYLGRSFYVYRIKENKFIVGENNYLNCTIHFEDSKGTVIIGDNTYIGKSDIVCKSKIVIGNNVFISWNVTILDHDSHSLNFKERRNDMEQQLENLRCGQRITENKNWDVVRIKDVNIHDDAWIGVNSTILRGVTIGEKSIVAANTVVTKDVPPYSIVAGNPGKIIKKLK